MAPEMMRLLSLMPSAVASKNLASDTAVARQKRPAGFQLAYLQCGSSFFYHRYIYLMRRNRVFS
jgi:hypothetical protein